MIKLTQNQIHQLERYVNDALPEAEKLKLEMEMERNPHFEAEAKAYMEIFQGFKGLEIEQFETTMQGWEQQFQQSKTTTTSSPKLVASPSKKFRFQYWAAAAILALLIPTGLWFFGQESGPQDHQALFAANFVAEDVQTQVYGVNRGNGTTSLDDLNAAPDEAATRLEELEDVPEAVTPSAESSSGKASTADNYKLAGLEAYNQKKYESAIEHFSNYLEVEKSKMQHEIRFYLGVSYLAENYTQKAKSIFLKLSKLKNNRKHNHFRQSSEWYLALTLIKEGQIKKATEQLTDIVNAPKKHNYHDKAQNMLVQIEKYNIQ